MNNQIRPPSNPTPTTSPQHVGGGVRGRVTRETNSTPLRDESMPPPPATADTMNLGRPAIEIASTNNTAPPPPHFPAPAFQTTSRPSCSLLEFPALCGDAVTDLNTVTLQMVVFDPVSSRNAVNRKYYRLADRCLEAITHLKGEIVIRALFRFVVEIAKLGIMEATKQKLPRPGVAGLYDVAECFGFGRPRLRKERRLFQTTTEKKSFLMTFYRCLFRCHGFQLNSLFGAVDTDTFKATAFKGCPNCRSED